MGARALVATAVVRERITEGCAAAAGVMAARWREGRGAKQASAR